MIKRPWQIWTLYGLCVLLVVPAMLWLSYTTWQLDRARELDRLATEDARRQAEVQERVSSALWRMDWLMIPLVAQEAARPYYMYQPFVSTSPTIPAQSQEANQPTPQPSPILTQPSELILLHFQIEPDNQFSSPQNPQGAQRETAVHSCGVSPESIETSEDKLHELQNVCSYESVSFACPSEKLPSANRIDFPWQAKEIAAQVTQSMASTKEQFLANAAPQVEQQLQQSGQGQSLDDLEGQPQPIDEVQKQQISQRGSSEFLQRDKATQSFTKGQLSLNRYDAGALPAESEARVTEGVMRPFWIGEILVMARRVDLGDRVVIQGCWLNWEKIRESLSREISDVLPGVGLQPASADANDSSPGRKLATLPVQLTNVEKSIALIGWPNPARPAVGISGLKISLAVAWACLILGLIAIAALLRGVLRLSERRAAFASAVTHELRTPLTTFRMYAEMLAERMVPSAEKQQQYARTMKVEADRLGHLVENVLRFARLESRNVATRSVPVKVGALFDRFVGRLHERCEQTGMKLVLDLDESTRELPFSTDPGTVEQIVFNLIDNACKYAASARDKTIHLSISSTPRTSTRSASAATKDNQDREIRITVRDHGPGIDARMSKRLFTAFSKSDQEAAETARGVGLGLALCRRMAADLGGRLVWDKTYTEGASFILTLR